MVSLLIKVSYQYKYGTLLKLFVSRFSFGGGHYPNNITTVTDVLSNHRLDPKVYENNKRYRYKESNETE